jgi:hypothetical protein
MADKNQHILGPLSANEKGIFYSGGLPFLYLSGTRDNLLEYSQQLDNTIWTKTQCSITADVTAAPDTVNTADKLYDDATPATTHYCSQNFLPDSTSTYVISAFLKAAEYTWARLSVATDGFPSVIGAYYNLGSGVKGSNVGSPDATGIEDCGDGWYFCWFTATSDAAVSTAFDIHLAEADNDITYDGDSSSGIYVWQSQIEVGTFPSALIPTINTNYLTYSQSFANSDWTKTRSSISANVIIAPDGQKIASKLVEDNTPTDTHYINQSFTPDGSSNYVFSVYVKAAERSWVRLNISTAGFSAAVAGFYDLVNGVVGSSTGSPVTFGIEDVGNGWYRCYISKDSDAAASTTANIHLAEADNDITYSGDNSSGVYIWQAQLEIGTIPSEPIIYTEDLVCAGVRSATLAYWTDSNIPQALLNPKFSLEMISLFAYDDIGIIAQLLNYSATDYAAFTTSDTLSLVETSIVKVTASPQYTRGDKVKFILDRVGGSIEVRGADSGNQIYPGVPWNWPTTGNLYLGSKSDKSEHLFGLVSEPENFYFYDGILSRFENMTFAASSVRIIDINEFFTDIPINVKAIRNMGGKRIIQMDNSNQNEFTYTQQFDHADWTKTNSSIIANDLDAPDSTTTADKLVEDGTPGVTHYTRQSITFVTATTYVFSVYAKADERGWVRLLLGSGAFPGTPSAYFNVVNGAIGTVSVDVVNSGVDYAGNGWYRCWIAATADASVSAACDVRLATVDGTDSYNGDGSSGLHIWQAQIEDDGIPSSPILCEASATTRNADRNYLLSDAVPTKLRGKFTIDVMVRFDYNTTAGQLKTPTPDIVKFGDSGPSPRIRIQYTGVGATDYIKVYNATTTTDLVTPSVSTGFLRERLFSITVDPVAGSLIFEGLPEGGNGEHTGTVWVTTEGTVAIGCTDTGGNCPGFVSEPYTPLFLFPDGTYANASQKYMFLDRLLASFASNVFGVLGYNGRLFYQSEQSVQNIYTYSSKYDETDWTKKEITVAEGTELTPHTDLDDWSLTPTTNSDQHYIRQAYDTDGTSQYCLWGIFKANGYNWVQLKFWTLGFVGTPHTYFDVYNGVVGTTLNVDSYGIEPMGNGWFLCYISALSDAAGAGWPQFSIHDVDYANFTGTDYTGDGTSDVLCCHTQFEIGYFPSSVITSLASATTRAADSYLIASADVLPAFRKDIAVQWIPDFDSDQGVTDDYCLLDFDTLSGSPRITIQYEADTGVFRLLLDSVSEIVTSVVTFIRGQIITVGFKPGEKSLTILGCTSGDNVYTSTTGSSLQTTAGDIYIGCLRNSTLQCNGKISKPYSWK